MIKKRYTKIIIKLGKKLILILWTQKIYLHSNFFYLKENMSYSIFKKSCSDDQKYLQNILTDTRTFFY